MRRRVEQDVNYGRRGALQGVGGALLGLLLAAWATSCGFKIPPCVVDGSCLPRPAATATVPATPSDTATATASATLSATSTPAPTATPVPPHLTPPARPCPCLQRIGIGPLGGAQKPHRAHGGLQCWTIDTTPKFGFGANGKGLPDNADHPNFGGHCEFPGAPSWFVDGGVWSTPLDEFQRNRSVAEDNCYGLDPHGKPRQCYQYEICGAPGQPFTISAYPPLPLTDLYAQELISACAGGDGHGSYTGAF